MIRATLLLCFVALDVAAQGRIFDRPCGIPSRRSSRGGVACGSSGGFALSISSSYAAATPSYPLLSETGLAMLCTPNAGSTAWQCVDSTGASICTVTQGAGATYVGTFSGAIRAINAVTDTTAPTAVCPTLDALWAGDITIVAGGYGTANTSAFPNHFVLAGTGGGVVMRFNAGNYEATWLENGSFPVSNVTQPGKDGWSIVSARRTGNNRITRVNGADGTTVATVTTKVAATTGAVSYFGRSNSAGQPLDGPLAFVAIYSVGKTAAQMTAIESAFWGNGVLTASGTGQLVGLDMSTTGIGPVNMMQSGASLVHPTWGVRGARGFTNAWAANALDATSWTDVATPVVTANTAAGPFFRWKNTNEADLIVDDNAAAFEGKQSTGSAGTAVGKYTASCYLAAGTSGVTTTKARLVVTTDGAGSTNCDFSALTSTFTRQKCTATVSGVATFIRGQVLVGNALGDTGSILVAQCQLNANGWAESPTVDNAAVGGLAATLDGAAWPSTSLGGKYETIFTPIYSPISDWVTAADVIYLVDSFAAANHTVANLFGYTASGHSLGLVRNGATIADMTADGVDLTPFQTYAISTEWRPVGGGLCKNIVRFDSCGATPAASCHASTILMSDLTGTATCPAQSTNTALANRFDASFPTSVFVNYEWVYSP